MSQRKRVFSNDAGNLSVTQFFTTKPRTAVFVEPPNQESVPISSSKTIGLLNDCTSENN